MNNLKQIRIQFGLNQQEMAQYLKIKRSLLSLCETNKRDLPTHALVTLADMELFLIHNVPQLSNIALVHEAAQVQKAQSVLEKHQKEVAFQQMALQKKLALLQEKYRHNVQLLVYLMHLEQKAVVADTFIATWITTMKTAAMQNIESNGLHHQAKIILQLQLLIPQDLTNFIDNLRKNFTNS